MGTTNDRIATAGPGATVNLEWCGIQRTIDGERIERSPDLVATYINDVADARLDTMREKAKAFYRKNINALMTAIGADVGRCNACGRGVWWIRTKNGKAQPFTADGFPHHGDCKKWAK